MPKNQPATHVSHETYVALEKAVGALVAYVQYDRGDERHIGMRLLAQNGATLDVFDASLWPDVEIPNA